MKKQVLSLLLLAALLCTLLPQITLSANAASYSGSCGAKLNWSLDTGTGALTITGSGEMSTAPWYDYRTSIKTISLPAGLTSISSYAFIECTGVKEITFPNTLTEIDIGAFYGCTGLTKLTLPAGITNIFADAFAGCTGLKEVSLPAQLTIIYDTLFSGCSSLTQVDFPSGLTEIRNRAFVNCTSLTKLTLPSKLTYIGMDTFKNCSKLTEVEFPEGLEKIESAAFLGCTALKGIAIPKSVTKIGNGAFGFHTQNSINHQFTIYGYVGTVAETYATNNGLVFVARDPRSGFIDVNSGGFYYNSMLWALNKGITTGTSPFTFNPEGNCTRAQVVTFLWRAMGSPNASSSKHSFVDVQESAFYYKAMLWAVEKGITKGTDDTHFSPNAPCNRAQVVTFLHRALGEPKSSTAKPAFVDVEDGTFYYKAMLWAVENGITNGTDGTHFSPNKPCTRAQVVTFLERAMKK